MPQSLQFNLQTSLFHQKKNLSISPENIDFGNANFSKFEISGLRYGVKAINGYRFRIGRLYCIDIQSLSGQIIKIRIVSFYQIRRKKLDEKFRATLIALFENFINDISRDYIDKFNKEIDFTLLGVSFIQEGIKLQDNAETIAWLDLGTRNYRTYYSLFQLSKPGNYKTFSYLEEWNTAILYAVSRYILRAKGLLKTE